MTVRKVAAGRIGQSRKFRVSYTVDVEVVVNDPDVFDRITGPKGDEWRAVFYGLHTEHDVIGHLAFNALLNDVRQAYDLDGWGDLDADAATMSVDRDSAVGDDIEEHKP